MRNKIVMLMLSVAIIGSLVVAGCAKPAPPPSAPGPAPTPTPAPSPGPTPTPTGPKEIRIGCSMPLTGMFAAIGEGNTFGMRAAVEDINKQGGVYVEEYGTKLPIKMMVVNNESDSIKAGSLAEDLVLRDRVHFLSSGSLPWPVRTATVADRYKIPNIVAGGPLEPWLALRQEVTSHWPYTWFCGFAIAMPAPEGDFRHKPGYTVIGAWKGMLDRFGDQTNKRAGVFASDDPDGRGFYTLFPKALEEWGYDVLGEERDLGLFRVGTMDFTSMIKEWKDYDCEILWGGCPGPDFGTLWRQCHSLDFKPKIVSVSKAGLWYKDVVAWGGDLPNGIGTEIRWDPSFQDCPGIGDTTPETLFERWHEETGQTVNISIGYGYLQMQVLIDAIERAGTLDGAKVNKALGGPDMMTIFHRAKFDPETHFSRVPVCFGQWQKTDKPWVWERPIVFSEHDFAPARAEPIFPIPYD